MRKGLATSRTKSVKKERNVVALQRQGRRRTKSLLHSSVSRWQNMKHESWHLVTVIRQCSYKLKVLIPLLFLARKVQRMISSALLAVLVPTSRSLNCRLSLKRGIRNSSSLRKLQSRQRLRKESSHVQWQRERRSSLQKKRS